MENQKYCVWCGKLSEDGGEKCVGCGKKINPKENLFLDFLKEHTKDKLKGDIEDKVYETIKNFLLSHLYSVVVGLSIVVVGSIAVFGGVDSHINKTNGVPPEVLEVLGGNSGETDELSPSLTEADKSEIKSLLQEFLTYLDPARFQAGNMTDLCMISDELYFSLENAGKDEMGYYYYDETKFPYVRSSDNPTNIAVIYEETFSATSSTAIGQELIMKSYPVATVRMTHNLYSSESGEPKIVGSEDYEILLTKENGKWLVVESLLISNNDEVKGEAGNEMQ